MPKPLSEADKPRYALLAMEWASKKLAGDLAGADFLLEDLRRMENELGMSAEELGESARKWTTHLNEGSNRGGLRNETFCG